MNFVALFSNPFDFFLPLQIMAFNEIIYKSNNEFVVRFT